MLELNAYLASTPAPDKSLQVLVTVCNSTITYIGFCSRLKQNCTTEHIVDTQQPCCGHRRHFWHASQDCV